MNRVLNHVLNIRSFQEELDPCVPDQPLPVEHPSAQALAQWERGPMRTRPAQRFHELFEGMADAQPDRPAVVTEAGVTSYAQLDQQANRVAHLLLEHGVAGEEPVAVLTECSADLPATILGIWKAGAAYLPLALDQPPERLTFMARDAGARTLIALDGHQAPGSLAEAVHTILRPEDWARNVDVVRPAIDGSPEDLAYVIYTSGTSGTPKGVLIQHDSLVNASYMSGETFGLTCEDRASLVATPGFDASLWELGLALLHGMALVPVARTLRDDPWALKRWYKTHGVTVAFHVASYLRVSRETPFEGLRVLVTGGEAPNHDDARCYAGNLELWNAYGPTETCIFVCAERITTNPDPSHPLAVGRPLANTRISIRDDNGELAPPGIVGEVWLGGTGLARGYLNNPELMQQRFVQTPDGRFYRTGDLGRWTEDGRLELAGRIDDQIKLHGQRVELGEIEQALRSHCGVEEAVTLVETGAEGTKVLRAFVRLRASAAMPTDDQWRGYLASRLPMHMVPATVTSVAAIPLAATGKIDRERLLATPREPSRGIAKTPPRSGMEMRIATVWGELLGKARTTDADSCSTADACLASNIAREDNFFAMGGNSLLAVTMAHRLSSDLNRPVPVRELFAAPTLAGFARRIEELSSVPALVSAGSDLATEGQREFWVAEAAGLDTRTFTIPLICRVEGEMPSLDRWKKSWATLVTRHEALRTWFEEDAEGRLRRKAMPHLTSMLEVRLDVGPEVDTQPDRSAAWAFVRQRQSEPFDMGVVPLWRAGLVEVKDSGEHWFWLALHHSLGDGRSIGILVEELGALLRNEQLPPLTCDFGESARREEDYLGGPACAADGHYWRELLLRQPDDAFAEAPLDFPRSITAETGNHRFEARLDPGITQGLRALAREHEATLHSVLLTILALEARRRTGSEDAIIGATASTRETAAEDHLVGYYVNMLPIACHLRRDAGFAAALRQTQQTLAAGLQHARYPFARMYRDFWNERPQHRHPARYPLFDLAITENQESASASASLHLARIGAPAYEHTETSPGQDMVLTHGTLADGSLLLQWHVNAALYTRRTAECWFTGLSDWAVWLAENRERANEPLPALLPREAALLESWEQGAKIGRPALGFHELFERVVDTPGQSDRPAVISQDGVLSYGALECEANVLAHGLLLRGVVPGSVVGVLTGRSANLPAAVLGIWKAGATYLPLAVDLPQERLALMAREAGVAQWIVLDGARLPPKLAASLPPPLRPEELDSEFRRMYEHRPQRAPGAGAAAYIIYTSGSTGQPKGTLIGHDGYVNSVLGVGEALVLTRDDRSLMFASPSFDVSLSDIGLPLAFGAAMCPAPWDVLSSPNRFRAFLSELDVTVADITPTYLRLFDGAPLPSLRILVTGGEAPFPADVATYARRHRYFNAYGPTENAISSTMARLSPGDTISAGRPLPNTSAHLCDADGNPVPPGVIGELWLGGAGLARGYVARPDQTAAAFVETKRGRRYRTGDLGRWRETGEIEILGRIDDQVKLNGVRIELGEIEFVLASHPDVAQAVALLDGDPDSQRGLWAFVCLHPGKSGVPEEDWREYLASRLPVSMIPSAVIAVPAIPLTHAGKVDRTALKARLSERSTLGEDSKPHVGLEVEIAQLWSELLGHNSIRRDDNFFSIGGHSLLAIAVAHRLEESLGRPVPARELFAQPTLCGFAHRISQLSEPAPLEELSSDRATEGQREFWVAEHAGLDTRSFNIALFLTAPGKTHPPAQWRSAWAALVARHDALRTSFYEDGNGVLRRYASARVDTALDVATHPDMAAALACIRERQADSFAMGSAPLWRAGLAQISTAEQPVFWLAIHHSVADGVSLSVLAEELSVLLEGGSLTPVAGHFDRSAGREERYLASPACQTDAQFWRTMLHSLGNPSDETPQPFDEWPLDFPRAEARTARHARGSHSFRIRIDAEAADGLRGLAQKNGASLHSLFLTIMAHEVQRRTGRFEFLLGTAASARDSASEARIVGYYVNMLPVPCRVHASEPFEAALRTMQLKLAAGLQHARYPFARMYSDFRKDNAVAPHPERYPLFDIAVTESTSIATMQFGGIADRTGYELRLNAPPQDMVLIHEGQPDGGLILHWIVNAAIYEKQTAEAWIDSLAGWARLLAEGKRRPGSPLPPLLPAEENLLSVWEHGPAVPHPAPSFPAWFEQWVRMQPHRAALVTERGAQSYAELNSRANALAHALRARGITPNDVVGVFTGRSVALPETVLAIWKAGGCYLPLVEDLPAERLAFIARDAGIRLLVVLDGLEPPTALIETGCLVFRPEHVDAAWLSSHRHRIEIGGDGVRDSELAYVIYTSGSTGEPKGVTLHHQGLNNLALGVATALDMRSSDRASIMASPAFDAWIAELVMAWAAGGAVVPVLRSEMDDIAELQTKFLRLGVTVTTMPPSYLRLFEQADFPTLRVLLTAGEAPHRADALHYASRLRYMNGYGPTENTVAVSYGHVTATSQRLAAGRPLPNTSVHIRNSQEDSVPPGSAGMIWLGGMQLAAGYLNRPDLTAASFVETSAGRQYCTGDLGRWTHTGELEVLGRVDGQVKLRGQRVELGEIEHRLGSHVGVQQAVAAVKTSGDAQTLLAFACLHAGADEPTQAAWQDYLSAALPSFMVPSAVIRVAAIPMTIAGKVDRAALLRAPSESNLWEAGGDPRAAPPREGLEQRIAEVWAEYLECQSIGREDSFFDLGGDSLRAIAVVNQLRRTLECTVNDLYEHPRLAEFAGICRQRPEHLRGLIQSARRHWDNYRRELPAYEAERDAALTLAHRSYDARNLPYLHAGIGKRRNYEQVLLTGATGYLGSYLLRELLARSDCQVSVLVRGSDDRNARARLGKILCHYFGPDQGRALRDDARLTVFAGDLRRDHLGLSPQVYDRLANSVRAVFHSAANVKHFGHYWEFHVNNVAATGRLLKLAAHRAANPADFHFVSTLSVCGKAPEEGFQLFTEYDAAPEVPNENYYVRSKQEAERLVVAARQDLANACIHRVGSLVFASDGGPLQLNIGENALFRQLASFIQLGMVPDDSHVWLCHVDLVARGLVMLAGAANLTNETHHVENARRDTAADFVTMAETVRACGFGAFLSRLEAAVDQPEMSAALTATLENFGLYRGVSPQARARRLEIASGRTQILLAQLGLVWPALSAGGRKQMLDEMLKGADRLFSPHKRAQAVPLSHAVQPPSKELQSWKAS